MEKGLFDYFIKQTNKSLENLDTDFKEFQKKYDADISALHEKIDTKFSDLFAFKFQLIGGLIVFNVVIAAAIQIGLQMLGGK